MSRATDLSLPYVAGIFDGEGSVGLYEANRRFTFRTQLVQVETPASRALWDAMQERWGGHVSVRPGGARRPAMNWQLGQAQAAGFLTDIRPWLVLKCDQVDLALSWLAGRTPRQRDALGRAVARSDGEVLEARRVAVLLKRMKHD